MRVLVVGTVPPPGGERALALAKVAAARLAAGDAVEIWSPDTRSAAHDVGSLTGLRLPVRLAVASRRCDAVVLRIEPGLPFRSDESRLARAVLLALLGRVLQRFEDVTVHLDSPIAIPWGVGGRPSRDLWSKARVVVESDDDRDLLLAVPWIDEGRIEVAAPDDAVVERERAVAWPGPDTADLRGAVVAAVRARARAARRLELAGASLAGEPTGRATPDLSVAFEAEPEQASSYLGPIVRLAVHKVRLRLRAARRIVL